MRLAFLVSLVVAVAGASLAGASTPQDDEIARSIAELSVKACYDIASGAVSMPPAQDSNALDQTIKVIEGMGLSFGVNDNMMKGLGKPGIILVSQAMMGSKSFEQGDVVLAVGGRQPGCRVILLSEPGVNVTDAVSAQLSRSAWMAIPDLTTMRGAIERRVFFRRDSRGSPYLMNLMTITSPAPDSKLRMFSTTIRIPDGVQLPEGL